jgi:hypothetical protein
MAKFFGKVGYGVTEETRPGIWKATIIEKEYFGDLVRNMHRLENANQVNDNINISNEISIVADPFAYENFHLMKYVTYMGSKWKINSVEVQYPRLILSIGGLYNEDE